MTKIRTAQTVTTAAIIASLLSGCATMEPPRNAVGSLYAHEQESGDGADRILCRTATLPAAINGLTEVPADRLVSAADVVAAGDRLQLTVAGDTARYTGAYVVAGDGSIDLAGGLRIMASGQTIDQLERTLRTTLVERSIVRAINGNIRLQHVEQASLPIAVSGAVFFPGVVRIGERPADTRNTTLANPAAGDLNIGRSLSTALRAAGGVRPDASISDIVVIRGQEWTRIDMAGAMNGAHVSDLRLVAGDQVLIASVGCLQADLVRPSPITMPGIRVFMSNLSRPSGGNGASAIGSDSTSLPYGTRLLQGLVSANCVGGSAMNAGRTAVLISRNPVTGQSVVVSRSIEDLVRGADRDRYDPYLMPGDAIACYDSAAMNLRDVISTLSETVTPVVLLNSVVN